MRVHRVGSITTGVSMVVLGVAFLLKLYFDIFSFRMICMLWPLIFIGLGVEILVNNVKDNKMIYDKAAVFLLVVMTFFAMGMALMCEGLKNAVNINW